MGGSVANPVVLFLGFLALGIVSAVIFDRSRRPGTDPGRRRVYGILWVLVLLVGGPLWLVVAAMLGVL